MPKYLVTDDDHETLAINLDIGTVVEVPDDEVDHFWEMVNDNATVAHIEEWLRRIARRRNA